MIVEHFSALGLEGLRKYIFGLAIAVELHHFVYPLSEQQLEENLKMERKFGEQKEANLFSFQLVIWSPGVRAELIQLDTATQVSECGI